MSQQKKPKERKASLNYLKKLKLKSLKLKPFSLSKTPWLIVSMKAKIEELKSLMDAKQNGKESEATNVETSTEGAVELDPSFVKIKSKLAHAREAFEKKRKLDDEPATEEPQAKKEKLVE